MLLITSKFRSIAYLVSLYISCLTTGCMSTGNENKTLGSEDNQSSNQKLYLDSFAEPDQIDNKSRGTSSFESGTVLISKAVLLDPVVRPVSTMKAYYGLMLKSTYGLIERTFIEKVRFPKLEQNPVPGLSNAAPMDIESWERELDELTTREASTGTINFLVDGDEYFSRLYQSINNAEQSVDISTYIYDNDDVAVQMADLLRSKSDHLEIKVLVDGLADLFATRTDSPSMPADVDLPPSIAEYLTYGSKVEFRKQSNPWFTGDHAKITVIDGDLAFLGGMNIGREYRYDWHDLMMEIDGPIVRQLQHEFDLAWAKAGPFGDFAWLATAWRGYEPDDSGEGYPIRILTTSIHDSELFRAQVAAIRRSRNRIYIENTYFSDDKILFELAMARRRGVDVRVILASNGDSGVLNLSNQTAVNVMLRNGIRVYSYPGMTHVKAAVYDGWACLGSANFDKLSLQLNHEVNLGTSDPETVEKLLNRVFYPDFKKSTELHDPFRLDSRHHFAELIADELF